MAKAISGPSKEWQNFFLCVILHLLLPLLPLGIELWQSGQITAKSATIAAAMYAISIGNSSRSRLIFGLGIVISLLFSAAYGIVIASANPLPKSAPASFWAIGCMLLFHEIERYNRHVIEKAPFWEF